MQPALRRDDPEDIPVVDRFDETTVETMIDYGAFTRGLRELGVPEELVRQAWAVVQGPALGILVYGSWARRDADNASDLDLLLLSDTRAVVKPVGKVSLVRYSVAQLSEAHRTLYGMHLARDGVILHDTGGVLEGILSGFSPPNPQDLLRRVREFAVILDVTPDDQREYLPGLTQVARYLLRTATYALALRDGAPCFSIKELAVRFGRPEFATLLSSHPDVYPEPTADVLADLTVRLAATVGTLPANPYGSLQALIVAMSVADPDVAHLATFALGDDATLPYSDIPKVVL